MSNTTQISNEDLAIRRHDSYSFPESNVPYFFFKIVLNELSGWSPNTCILDFMAEIF